jgi:hypothetical protein
MLKVAEPPAFCAEMRYEVAGDTPSGVPEMTPVTGLIVMPAGKAGATV